MIRRVLLVLVGLVIVGAILFFTLAPGIVERSMNKVDGEPLIEVSEEARALHQTLTIVDLHSDTLLWKRSVLEDADRGHMDLGRLQAGNVRLQVFSSVTKTPENQNYDNNSADGDNITGLVIGQLQPIRTWTSLLERSVYHGEKLETAAQDSDGALDVNGFTLQCDLGIDRCGETCAEPLDRDLGFVGQGGELERADKSWVAQDILIDLSVVLGDERAGGEVFDPDVI